MMAQDSSIIIPSQQPQPPVEAITFMDSDLLNAAEDGDMELFNKYQGDLHCLLDGRRNTALHIYSRPGGCKLVLISYIRFLCYRDWEPKGEFSLYFVEQLVDKCPSLLLQPNDRGEMPLHIAARHGHYKIVKFLIQRAKVMPQLHEGLGNSEASGSWRRTMLRMKDKADNTAFHIYGCWMSSRWHWCGATTGEGIGIGSWFLRFHCLLIKAVRLHST